MTTEWIPTGGKKPILPSHVFVYVRFAGDSREEAEAYRDGYGQSVDSVHSWADTIEYRRKHPAPMTNDQTVTQALEPCPFCGGEARRFTIGENEPENAGGDVISCTKCGASSHVEFGRKENLVDRWNHRTAHSGEGRSNGAGEDVERLVRIFRSLPLHGDAGCDKLTDDEWRQVALAALTDISLSARQGEVERLTRVLRDAADTFDKLAASMREEEADLLAVEIAVAEQSRDQCLAALAQPEAGGER